MGTPQVMWEPEAFAGYVSLVGAVAVHSGLFVLNEPAGDQKGGGSPSLGLGRFLMRV